MQTKNQNGTADVATVSAAANANVIQCSLNIGAVNDPLEHEADAMADKVMRMPDSLSPGQGWGDVIQRKCDHCEEEEQVQRKPLAASITPFIQKKGADGGTAIEGVTNKINSTKGSGSGMDSNTQNFMQSRFGTDFSGVKIHTGSDSIQMNRELNAKAFTVGSDIYFNEGQYQPNAESGKHLLAHELTHTVQQGKHSAIQKVSAASCCNAKDCGGADKVGSGTPTSYSLTLAVDKEEDGLGRLSSGNVGHTWVKVDADDGTHFSYGFWPQTGFSADPLKAFDPVLGCVHHPDIAHEPPAATNYIDISYSITKKGYTDTLSYAESICKATPHYDLNDYNCTSFAIEMAKKAGVSPPSSTTLAIDNPNALYEGIEESKKATKKKGTGSSKATKKTP